MITDMMRRRLEADVITHLACWYHGATSTEPLCGRTRRKVKLTTDPKAVDCPACNAELARNARNLAYLAQGSK